MQPEHPETFASLFNHAGRTFEIPAYQRAYSWGEEELKQFIADLHEQHLTSINDDSPGAYYLGHFLFEQAVGMPSSQLYVIDGQQRLTTCTIFFSSLCRALDARAAALNTTDPDTTRLRATYLFNPEGEVQKLRTVPSDNNFFEAEIIQQRTNHFYTPDTTSQRRIRAAREFFDKTLSSVQYSTQELRKWSKLVSEAAVTHLIVTDKVRAAQIFAFQNDRGKKLKDLEILKSYFMLQILLSGQRQHIIDENITSLERDFGRIYTAMESVDLSEDEVLAYFWRSNTSNPYSGESTVTGVKKKLASVPAADRVAWIKNFVAGLAQAFAFVKEIETNATAVARDLRDLNRMSLAYPVLLRSYRDGIDEPTKARLFRFLENITFRYRLKGGRADIHTRFNYHFFNANIPLNTQNLNAAINQFVNMLKQGEGWGWYWNDRSMRQCLDAEFYQNPVDNYVLWKYERYISPTDYQFPPSVGYRQLMHNESIEHIAPQKPTHDDENLHLAGYGKYDHISTPNEGIRSGNWLNRLGNLMLISQSQNSRMGNRPFKTKLIEIQNESLLQQHKKLTEFLAKDSEGKRIIHWDKDAIKRRHDDIVDAALKIWDLNNI